MACCGVSYLDTEGLRHSVQVDAGTLFEAVVLGASDIQATRLCARTCMPARSRGPQYGYSHGNLEASSRMAKLRGEIAGGGRMKERFRALCKQPTLEGGLSLHRNKSRQ